MTPEELELYKELQPLFFENCVMRESDYIYCPKCNKIKTIYLHACNGDSSEYIYLPLPIDPINPERGLWGMVNWEICRIIDWGCSGEVSIYPYKFDRRFAFIGTPTLALLKALEWQWRENMTTDGNP